MEEIHKFIQEHKDKTIYLTSQTNLNENDLKDLFQYDNVSILKVGQTVNKNDLVLKFNLFHNNLNVNIYNSLCHDDAYDIRKLKLDRNVKDVFMSTIIMFPKIYKLLIRLLLDTKTKHLIYSDDDSITTVLSRFQDFIDMDNIDIVNRENFTDNFSRNLYYNNIHFITHPPDFTTMIDFIYNQTVDKMFFSNKVYVWFYSVKSNYESNTKLISKYVNAYKTYKEYIKSAKSISYNKNSEQFLVIH